ncbi:hypothetical protein HEQ72_10515 [Haematospirillum sp. 15-248]|nr:hypothetical protein [Haematospirillum sp. 15-248]NKD88733.1 hypothetical protein [Haematospirillum sp. 15-248]
MPNLTEITARFFRFLRSTLDIAPDPLTSQRRRRVFRHRMASVSGHRCRP